MDNVIGLKRFNKEQEALISEMQERIEALVYEYGGGKVPLAVAIGVLEIVKKNIIQKEE